MKTSSTFWGSFFLSLGTFLLLINFDLIDWALFWIADWWPVLLILWGLFLLRIAKPLRNTIAGVSGIFLSLVIVSFMNFNLHEKASYWSYHYSDDEDVNFYSSDFNKIDTFSIDWNENIKEASFDLSGSAAEFKLKANSDRLIDIEAYNSESKLSNEIKDSIAELFYSFDDSKNISKTLRHDREATISLSNKVLWNFHVNSGAADIDYDLRKFKVKKLDINSSASNIEIKIGQLNNFTEIIIDASASNIELSIPKEAGVIFETNTSLSAFSYHGFEESNESDYFQTKNYNEADQKIKVLIDGSVSNFDLKKY